MFSIHPFPAEAAEPGGLQVLLPPAYEIFYSALILLGLWLVLGKVLPKIYGMLDTRNQKIDEGLDAAEKAKEDAAVAKRERAELLRNAQEEAKGIRDDAQKDAGRIVAQARQEAVEEAARITDAANRHIQAERKAAEVALRQDVGALATELAERIVGEQLKDTALSQRVIDRFMDEVEADLEQRSVGADA